ncbi:hypothetical protein Dxin01_03343 [Deinococcus xinjiangensis]|uniref:Uncharacterized protein n=1 Tax=Deinococcus xinjiangensis TaxID=457454 RepID=A0ABP9VED4_9DEIO
MTSVGPGPNKNKRPRMTDGERQLLHEMHRDLGAWTHQEALTRLGEARFKTFLDEGILGAQDTDMGLMYHLLARGRVGVYFEADKAVSLIRQLDQAYVRLCMAEKKWDFTPKDSPFFKGWADLFPGLALLEGYTEYGAALIGGKLSGDGYSPLAITSLGNRLRSTALSQRFQIVILTPNARKGQQAAAPFRNFLKLVPCLPSTGSPSKRFNLIPSLNTPTQPGPHLTPNLVRDMSHQHSKLTLDTLCLPREGRVEAAHLALQKDGVITTRQLKRYFALSFADLPGTLFTQAIIRPAKNNYGLEVQDMVLTSSSQISRLDDAQLNHKLMVAQMRYQLGQAPDESWITSGKAKRRGTEPDARRVLPDGTMQAIEADSGEYRLTLVLRKLESYRDGGLEGTLWGTISQRRINNLTAAIKKSDPALEPQFTEAKWWA